MDHQGRPSGWTLKNVPSKLSHQIKSQGLKNRLINQKRTALRKGYEFAPDRPQLLRYKDQN